MATYYLSSWTGNDSNAGTSVAAPKLTLAAIEAIVAAGDWVWIEGGSTFRVTHTTTASGSSGNPITFAADVSGKVFGNGRRGKARITGSNNDQTRTRSYGIHVDTDAYRTFDGIHVDSTTDYAIYVNGANAIFRRCFAEANTFVSGAFHFAYCDDGLVDRCYASGGYEATALRFDNNGGHTARNSIFDCSRGTAVAMIAQAGCTIENCLSRFSSYGYVQSSGGSAIAIRNSLAYQCQVGYDAGNGSTVTVTNCGTAGHSDDFGTNIVDGGGNVTYPIQFDDPLQLGIDTPFVPFMLRADSPYASRAVASGPSVDFYGAPRPVTAPPSWGPVQRRNRAYETPNADPLLATITLEGEGYIEWQVVIPGSATRDFSVEVSWTDNTNIGTKPRLELLGPNGDQASGTPTDDATGSGSAETLLVSTTNPSSVALIYYLRCYHRTTGHGTDPDLEMTTSTFVEA